MNTDNNKFSPVKSTGRKGASLCLSSLGAVKQENKRNRSQNPNIALHESVSHTDCTRTLCTQLNVNHICLAAGACPRRFSLYCVRSVNSGAAAPISR